mgnify:CR=1 FL=1
MATPESMTTTDRDQAGLVWHLYELTGEGDG